MEQIETGLLADRIPFIRGGAGPRRAVVFFGGNALLKRLDRASSPSRYARQVARLLPSGLSFWTWADRARCPPAPKPQFPLRSNSR